jgi:hypothetical protein
MTPITEPPRAGYRRGHHVCHTFQHEAERQAALVPFLREGLVRGERCVCAAAPATLDQVATRLQDAGVDVARERARQALVLIPPEEAYGTRGAFDGDKTLSFIGASIDACLADGFTGLRGAGEIPYALTDKEMGLLRAYELRVNDAFVGRPFTALCSYSRRLLADGPALEMLRTHPQAWVDGELCANPFFGQGVPHAGIDEPSLQLTDMLRLIKEHQRLRTREQRFLVALAELAADLTSALAERTATLEEQGRRDTDTIVSLERHLAPPRLDLQQLRLSLRDGDSPPAAELIHYIERFWSELRGLTDVVSQLRGDRPDDRPGT